MKERPFFFFFLSLIAFAGAIVDTNTSYNNDPYLAFRPPFVRSLPVQIMLTGVVLTLVAVLFIHLLFTAKYHWSLAPVNYVLQLSGVTTLLISLIATIHVVLSSSFAQSEKWPYMLSYIAVNVPPLDLDANAEGWTMAERATWLVMTASTSVLIQITHIQFLTLLYPSSLEGRLIFALLGPLAIVAATMQLLLINYNDYLSSVNCIAVRNVCNATLSLLFTSSLFIWGLLVNRKQAWRTDGGTAIFGGAALSLALVSTALNFLYVHKENEFVWLPGLMWAVVLWQSFLGWWWWVGAGSGSGFATEDENRAEKLRREAKRASRKREAREKKKEKKTKAQNVWQGVTAVFAPGITHPSESQIRSRTPFGTPFQSETAVGSDPNTSISASESVVSQSNSTTSSVLSLPRTFLGVLYRCYISLRHAHVIAARQQTADRVHRVQDVDQQNSWGGFGWRRKIGVTPSVEVDERVDTMTKSDDEDEQDPQMEADWQTRSFGGGGSTPVYGELDRTRNHQNLRTDHDCQDAGSNHEVSQGQQNVTLPPPVAVVTPSSMWWWGPLRRWRLQDSTVY